MNTQSNAMHESSIQSQGSRARGRVGRSTMYWSIRREIWENHSIYIAPLPSPPFFYSAS